MKFTKDFQKLGIFFILLFFVSVCSILTCSVGVYANDEVKKQSESELSEETEKSETKKSENTILNFESKHVILIEPVSGKIIYEKQSDERVSPASITKIMTILLIYEAIDEGKIKLEDIVTVSAHAASMGGSQIFLEEGERQTVQDLLKSIIIASANDSSVAMAEFIAGSEGSFVELMNQKAKELGMNNTNFMNTCGLDADNHYSSAKDIALMSKELIVKYPQVEQYSTTRQDTIIHTTRRGSEEFGLTNTNKLLNSFDGITGLKTGSTSKALYCLSATARRDDMNLVGVVLAAPNPATRFAEAAQLLNFGFANYTIAKGDPKDKVMGNVKIFKGEEDFVDVKIKDEIVFLAEKGSAQGLEGNIEIIESIKSPVEMNTKAGEVVYYYNGIEVGRTDLITTKNVGVASMGKILTDLFNRWTNFN